jgi:fatty acid/phospholipid biosynthesis enzyme
MLVASANNGETISKGGEKLKSGGFLLKNPPDFNNFFGNVNE